MRLKTAFTMKMKTYVLNARKDFICNKEDASKFLPKIV